ncbi:MAG: MarR family transcriptional regulator [Oceanospirillaceae bacterium]
MDQPSQQDITDRFSFGLHTASRLVKNISVAQLKELELSQAQWRTLSMVCTQPQATLQQLTAFAHISQPLLSQAVKSLEERGFVSRETPEQDKRSSLIVATQEGIQLYGQAYAAMMKVEDKISAVLGKRDGAKFKALLNTLISGLE